MVAGYHLIWTVYGYWLPNDPRGSTSKEVRVEPIAALGEHHYGRKQEQPASKELRQFLQSASDALAHTVCPLDDADIAIVGAALGAQVKESGYVCYACVVMPDHVHILIRRHNDRAEDMIAHLQRKAKSALIEAGKRPVNHPVWTDGAGWKAFINSRRQFESETHLKSASRSSSGISCSRTMVGCRSSICLRLAPAASTRIDESRYLRRHRGR